MPNGNKCPISLRSIEKKLILDQNALIHFVCSECDNLLDPINWLQEFSNTQLCVKCGTVLIPFVTFELEQQLRQILKPDKILQIKENNKKARNKSPNDQSLIGITDGKIYQDFIQNSNSDLVISFNLNTDGAPMTSSKNFSIWPLFGTIVELNQSSRESFENSVLFGMFLSVIKPKFSVFLKKSLENYLKLSEKSFEIEDLSTNLRCQMLLVDLPAKAACLNHKQFNGYYGCTHCFIRGVRVANIKFPPHQDSVNFNSFYNYVYKNFLNLNKNFF